MRLVLVLCCKCLAPVAYVSGEHPIEQHTCPMCAEIDKQIEKPMLTVVK